MKLIPLTQDKFTMVDDSIFAALSQLNWYAHKSRHTFYAVRSAPREQGKQKMIMMHQVILGGASLIDHIDGDGLNNQTENLRACGSAGNARNRQKNVHSVSGYKGVSFFSPCSTWRARIMFCGRAVYLGDFKFPQDAARAYDCAALKYFGEFARLNFP